MLLRRYFKCMIMKNLIFSLSLIFMCQACTSASPEQNAKPKDPAGKPAKDLSKLSKAYFASGCFWCVEGIYEITNGVEEVVSGYAGGTEPNPTYELVSTGTTRYAETVEVYYDSTVVSYETLLKVFFSSHNPTTVDSQGPDTGPQYRSVIFYRNATEKALAESYIAKLLKDKTYPRIVTEVVPLTVFHQAEIYHQDYEKNNPDNPYVQGVSVPRMERYKEKHPELIKK